MRLRYALALAAVLTPPLAAQGPEGGDSAMTIGSWHAFDSRVLGESRPYLLYRPPIGDRVPVIVLLDGDVHFHHITGAVRFLIEQGRIPPALIVAVPNTADRTRDLTPPTARDSAFRTAGGADRMLAFLADELLPEIARTYPTQPYRVLVGHSFGGLFATHAMLARPDVFQAYVAISPSWWWDGERLVDSLAALLARGPAPRSRFYATMGALEDSGQMVGPFQRAQRAVAERATPSLGWWLRLLDGEDHGSTPHRSVYDGLQMIFAPFRIPAESLVALGVAGLDRRYAELRAQFGFPDRTPEVVLNVLGYRLLADTAAALRDQAVAAFRENARRHPGSANTYDSLGDSYRALGRIDAAIACYLSSARVGRATPDAGNVFRNGDIATVSAGKAAALARLARATADTTAIAADVVERCVAGR